MVVIYGDPSNSEWNEDMIKSGFFVSFRSLDFIFSYNSILSIPYKLMYIKLDCIDNNNAIEFLCKLDCVQIDHIQKKKSKLQYLMLDEYNH